MKHTAMIFGAARATRYMCLNSEVGRLDRLGVCNQRFCGAINGLKDKTYHLGGRMDAITLSSSMKGRFRSSQCEYLLNLKDSRFHSLTPRLITCSLVAFTAWYLASLVYLQQLPLQQSNISRGPTDRKAHQYPIPVCNTKDEGLNPGLVMTYQMQQLRHLTQR